MLKGFTRKFKPLEILTEENTAAIHKGTLGVLWQTGVTFHHEKALRLFDQNGCKVDYEEKRVHFPPGLVEECLRKAPSSFHIKARDPKNDLLMGGDTLYTGSAPGMQTVDLNTWEMRIPTRKENYDATTVLDALENVYIMSCYTPYFGFQAVPPVMAMLESDACRIRSSAKVLGFPFAKDSEVFSISMAQAVGTEAIGNVLASPPLTYYTDAVEACFRFVEAGLVIFVCAGPIMGGSAPATYAGATITNNAEITAGIVLAQLIKPGTRVLANDFAFAMNMQTGAPAFGEVATNIHQIMFNQIWRGYGVPTVHSPGYCNSKRIDFQNAYERALGILLGGLSGTNYMLVIGAVHGELTFSPIMSILDNDIVGRVGRVMQGAEVNDETMAIDLINQVGPIPGNYLNAAHTRQWWQKEQFMAKAADRLPYPEWLNKGKKSCIDYAQARMEEILATHRVSLPLTPSQEEEIERILNEARNHYREQGLISDEEWTTYLKDLKSSNYPYG